MMQAGIVQLLPAPTDSVSSLRFSKGMGANMLVVTDWSGSVSLFDANTRTQLEEFPFQDPALSVDFLVNRTVVTGSSDMNIYNISLRGEINKVGVHTAPVSEVRAFPALSPSVLVSGGWDRMVALWDTRNPGVIQAHVDAPGKVFAMAPMGSNLLTVATSGRYVYTYDVRFLDRGPVQRRESALRHQSRCLAANPSGTGFVLGSVEGRVGVEYMDPEPSVQAGRFAFKTHRRPSGDGTSVSVFPVHDVAFHPDSDNIFVTVGGDGEVNVWDIARRRRVGNCVVGDGSVGLVACDFREDGNVLAVASSYCWEYGRVSPIPQSGVFLIAFNQIAKGL